MSDTPNHIERKRHSLAHLLAAAVQNIYPNAKPTIGPAVDNGFYYDFDFGEESIGEDDLENIEREMREILPTWDTFERIEVSEDKARERFSDNTYKLELIDEIVDAGEDITLYKSGEFVDLCRGGHVDDMSDIEPASFKLDKIAGAYWRGDEENEMLTRIYGLAFDSTESLEEFKKQREEAKKRDHRKLGKELDLFTFSEQIGSGLPLFTPKGTLMRDLIIDKIQSIQKEYGYERVTIPHLTKKDLYETSGHWEKFGDELFHVSGKEGAEFVMKPMNCPHHTQIYASKPRSYRDLPIRYIETSMVYRDEQSGELNGLSRVRSISQDDGHVFCTIDQVEQEIADIVDVVDTFYSSLGLYNENTFRVSLSVRDPETPEKYLGNDDQWKEAERTLESVAKEKGLPYERVEGDAAFYGPKLDFMFEDALGREWQLGTAQLDMVMPQRFELEYTDSDGARKTPIMIHRAIAGSLERFMSIIIEHFAGAFPLWLSPVQVRVLPISDDQHTYSQKVLERLQDSDVRADIDTSGESLGKKIRNTELEKIPYYLVIGSNEVKAGTVTVESRDSGKVGEMSVDDFLNKISDELDGNE